MNNGNKIFPNFNTMNNINNLPYVQNNFMNKINSDTSSISISSEKQIKRDGKVHKLFNTNTISKNSHFENDVMNKKRKRYIKNNKFVYVHPGSAAAKRMELEKVVY
jgi:predicted lipase